jgi:hypothetical protein
VSGFSRTRSGPPEGGHYITCRGVRLQPDTFWSA